MRDYARARKHSLTDINRDAKAASNALKKSFWGYVNQLLGDSPSDVRQPPTSDVSSPNQPMGHLKLQSGSQPLSVQELLLSLVSLHWMKLCQGLRGVDSNPNPAHMIRCPIKS